MATGERLDWRIFTPHRRVKRRVVFVHIPKCGGSSIVRGIHRTLPLRPGGRPVTIGGTAGRRLARNLPATDAPSVETVYKHARLYHMARPNTPYVGGHVPFDEASYLAFEGKHAWVTVLRDPVKRWISQYFYRRFRPGSPHADMPELDRFLDTPEAAAMGAFQVYFLGGAATHEDASSDTAVARACANLDRFDVVGRLDDLEGFTSRYEAVLGARLHVGWRNKNPKAKADIQGQLTSERVEAIRRLCAPDQALYDHAVSRGW